MVSKGELCNIPSLQEVFLVSFEYHRDHRTVTSLTVFEDVTVFIAMVLVCLIGSGHIHLVVSIAMPVSIYLQKCLEK